uniref:Secreted protein n=1 Tax=Trichuris muris TaxID=70415 RepID=A0A5S6QZC6_TRIMR
MRQPRWLVCRAAFVSWPTDLGAPPPSAVESSDPHSDVRVNCSRVDRLLFVSMQLPFEWFLSASIFSRSRYSHRRWRNGVKPSERPGTPRVGPFANRRPCVVAPGGVRASLALLVCAHDPALARARSVWLIALVGPKL